MILVIGNTPKKVELKDLGDCVYYKQKKNFSEAQYRQSDDLRREIKNGTLSIIGRKNEKEGDFDLPDFMSDDPVRVEKTVIKQEVQQPVIEALLLKIGSLEETIRNNPVPVDSTGTMKILTDKIRSLEDKISQKTDGDINMAVVEAIKKIEERLDKREEVSKNNDIFDRLEGILSRAPSSGSSVPERPVRPEDIYVPNINVEDLNSNIKLKVRTIEKSNNVNDSLKALRDLKNSNQNKKE